MKVLKAKAAIRIQGVSDAARRLGCSTTHLSAVIRGERISRRLTQRAKALGIKFPKIKKEG